MHITCALPNRALSDARSVTSSRCHCAAGTIARSTDAWMKPHGGKVTSLMASPLQESFAWKHIEVHASATTPKIIDDLIGNQYFSASWLSQPIVRMRMTGDWDRVPMSALPLKTAVWMRPG